MEKARSRQTNWSADEINLLTNLYEQNMDVIIEKHSNDITNKKKGKVWETIANSVSALGISQRSIENVKAKWGNLQKVAKREFCAQRSAVMGTGGGPRAPSPTPTAKIIDMLGATASFSGISGGTESFLQILNEDDQNGENCTEEAGVSNEASLPGPSSHTGTILLPVSSQTEVPATISDSRKGRKRKSAASPGDELEAAQLAWFRGDLEKVELKKKKLCLQIQLLQATLDKQTSLSAMDLLHSMQCI